MSYPDRMVDHMREQIAEQQRQLAAANERIRELKKSANDLGAAWAREISQHTAERVVSDKLEKALNKALEVGSHLMNSSDHEAARAALAEVAAIRAKGEQA